MISRKIDILVDDFKPNDFTTGDFEPDFMPAVMKPIPAVMMAAMTTIMIRAGLTPAVTSTRLLMASSVMHQDRQLIADNTIVADKKVDDNYVDEKDYYIGVDDTGTLVRETQEDVTKDELEPVAYNLYVAGSRRSDIALDLGVVRSGRRFDTNMRRLGCRLRRCCMKRMGQWCCNSRS